MPFMYIYLAWIIYLPVKGTANLQTFEKRERETETDRQ